MHDFQRTCWFINRLGYLYLVRYTATNISGKAILDVKVVTFDRARKSTDKVPNKAHGMIQSVRVHY